MMVLEHLFVLHGHYTSEDVRLSCRHLAPVLPLDGVSTDRQFQITALKVLALLVKQLLTAQWTFPLLTSAWGSAAHLTDELLALTKLKLGVELFALGLEAGVLRLAGGALGSVPLVHRVRHLRLALVVMMAQLTQGSCTTLRSRQKCCRWTSLFILKWQLEGCLNHYLVRTHPSLPMGVPL